MFLKIIFFSWLILIGLSGSYQHFDFFAGLQKLHPYFGLSFVFGFLIIGMLRKTIPYYRYLLINVLIFGALITGIASHLGVLTRWLHTVLVIFLLINGFLLFFDRPLNQEALDPTEPNDAPTA